MARALAVHGAMRVCQHLAKTHSSTLQSPGRSSCLWDAGHRDGGGLLGAHGRCLAPSRDATSLGGVPVRAIVQAATATEKKQARASRFTIEQPEQHANSAAGGRLGPP